jgi:hypothetical protein
MISGHLFCSFLALLLRKEFDERLTAAGVNAASFRATATRLAEAASTIGRG